jgi:nucleoside-diphosphate-sugar epimerase
MKIVPFGATGNVGQRIAREALSRGHEVVGVVRDPAQVTSPDPPVTLVPRVSAGADAVVSAISPRPNARGLAAPRSPRRPGRCSPVRRRRARNASWSSVGQAACRKRRFGVAY